MEKTGYIVIIGYLLAITASWYFMLNNSCNDLRAHLETIYEIVEGDIEGKREIIQFYKNSRDK